MTDLVKNFIEDNIKLIERNRWEEVYEKALEDIQDNIGEFTEVMLAADIHPEEYLRKLPAGFLSRSRNISDFNIPNNITSIDDAAFYKCMNLTNVTIGNGVTEIGLYAFSSCSSLTSVKIGTNVAEICPHAFSDCESLKSVIIPNKVIGIYDAAFYNCTGLVSVTIPDSMTSINDFTFWNCSSLTNVTIPDSVTYIGEDAFGYCKSLSIIIKNPQITFSDNVFEGCKNLSIQFAGTKEQWKKIAKNKFVGVLYTCKCTDGVVKKSR